MPGPREQVVYQERLWAPWWAWPIAGIVPVMLGVAYGHAISMFVGWVVGLGLGALLAAVLVSTAPMIEVNARGVRAKRARLEAEYLGLATPMDSSAARELRGVAADARAFTVLRGWLPAGVRLDVADPRDPTPYWYLSTKRPEALAVALNRVRDARTTRDVEGSESGVDLGGKHG